MMKKKLQLLLALFAFSFANAQDFSVGDYGYTIDGTNVKIQGYTGTGGAITIPSSVDNEGITYAVTTIGESAFQNNTTITSVVLPTTVTVLELHAFNGCSSITTMNCDHIVELGVSSLSALTALTDYGTFDSLTTMARNSFYNLNSLTEFVLPNTLTRYEIGVGNTFTSLKTFNIPSTVVHIDNAFFRFCPDLTALQVNWSSDQLNGTNGVTAINVNSKNFFGGVDISTITLYVPTGTSTDYASHAVLGGFNIVEGTLADLVVATGPSVGDIFTENEIDYKVTNIDPLEVEVTGAISTTVTIPATVTNTATSYNVVSIGDSAFFNNTTITSVVLPTSVVTIKNKAFANATNLESINLENVISIETINAFFNCPKITTVNFANATDIGNFALHGFGDSSVTSISIPNAVNIGDSAFRTTQITSIDIPASVLTIADRVFMDCTALTEITVNWTTVEAIPEILSTVFTNLTPAGIKLIVPTGTMNIYQGLAGWQDLTIEENQPLNTDATTQELGFYISSNIVTDTVLIQNTQLKNTQISIVDINGRVLLIANAKNIDNSIDVSSLPSGIFLMKVTTEGYTFVERIVKQ